MPSIVSATLTPSAQKYLTLFRDLIAHMSLSLRRSLCPRLPRLLTANKHVIVSWAHLGTGTGTDTVHSTQYHAYGSSILQVESLTQVHKLQHLLLAVC